jgi:glycerol-3-phosphate dehydrogenase
MKRDLDALAQREFDVLVVGGGINGAGVARDAAMRGLTVALVEQADFGSGTSSRSSKLVHGGLRYLEQRNVKLVLESSLERRVLLRIAPRLVHPLPFILPVYRGDRHGLRTIQAGMWLYDALSVFRNTRHRMLSASQALALEPALRSDGLAGAALYYDAQMDDARLCLANVISAAAHGAVVANYARVTAFEPPLPLGEGWGESSRAATQRERRRLTGARVQDMLDGREVLVRAKRTVNTAGPWLDAVRELDQSGPPQLRTTKGTHIVVPRLTERHAITLQSSDERVIFVIPWHGNTLIGTTDTDYAGRPEDVAPTIEEVDFLLNEVRRIIPGHGLTASDVLASFSGLRPLARGAAVTAGQLSREEHVVESPSGLLSLAGGKFTTYRLAAKRLVDRLTTVPCRTHLEPLPAPAAPAGLDQMVRHAVQEEMALTLEDVLRRRTCLALSPGRGLPEATPVSQLMAAQLGWTEPERRCQLSRYAATHGRAPELACHP